MLNTLDVEITEYNYNEYVYKIIEYGDYNCKNKVGEFIGIPNGNFVDEDGSIKLKIIHKNATEESTFKHEKFYNGWFNDIGITESYYGLYPIKKIKEFENEYPEYFI